MYPRRRVHISEDGNMQVWATTGARLIAECKARLFIATPQQMMI